MGDGHFHSIHLLCFIGLDNSPVFLNLSLAVTASLELLTKSSRALKAEHFSQWEKGLDLPPAYAWAASPADPGFIKERAISLITRAEKHERLLSSHMQQST